MSSCPPRSGSQRDTLRTAELVARTEAKLLALEWRVRDGLLTDAGKIGRAAQRILGPSGVGRLFDVEIGPGRFLYHYNDQAFAYEDALAGHYVLTTSLTPTEASTVQVVTAYQQLQQIERRFRVLKDFLHLRPVRHFTEQRVRGHIAICVYASILEALIAHHLHTADVRDPDLDNQHLTCARALRELGRIRAVTLDAGGRTIKRRHPPHPPPGPHPRRPRRRHPPLGPGPHHLTTRPRSSADVVETPSDPPPPTRHNATPPPNSGQTNGAAARGPSTTGLARRRDPTAREARSESPCTSRRRCWVGGAPCHTSEVTCAPI